MASAPDRSCISVYRYIQCAFGDEELCAHLWLLVGYMRVGVYVHSEWDMFARALYMMEITDWATEPSQAKPQRIYIRVYMVALNIRWAQASHQGWGGRNGCRETRELYAESTFAQIRCFYLFNDHIRKSDDQKHIVCRYGKAENLLFSDARVVGSEFCGFACWIGLIDMYYSGGLVKPNMCRTWFAVINSSTFAVCWLWNTYLTK